MRISSFTHHSLKAAVAVIVFVTVSAPAHAATRAEQTAACKGDALRLCTLSIPNEKKIAACLASKRDKLTPACKAMFLAKPAAKKSRKTSTKPS